MLVTKVESHSMDIMLITNSFLCLNVLFPLTREGHWSQNMPWIGSGIDTGDSPVSYWPIFSLSLVTVPEVFESFLLVSKMANYIIYIFFLFCTTTDTLLHNKDNDKDRKNKDNNDEEAEKKLCSLQVY